MVLTRSKSEEKLEKLVQLGQDGKTPVDAKIPTLKIPTLDDSDEDDAPTAAPTATAAPAPAPTIVAVAKKAFVVVGPPAPVIVAKKSLGDKIKFFLFVVVVLALLLGFLIPELLGALDNANVTAVDEL